MLTFSNEESTRSKALLHWLARTMSILFTLFPAFNETVMAAEEAPDTVQEVASSIQDTVLVIWADFVDRIPFLIAGLVVMPNSVLFKNPVEVLPARINDV